MTTAIASGLGVSLGWAEEAAYGTFVTPARWLMGEKVTFKRKPKRAQGQPLRGSAYDLGSRRHQVSWTVDGSFDTTAVDKQLGVFFKHALACKTPKIAEIGSSGAYTQTYAAGNVLQGLSLSAQMGVPISAGTVQAFSVTGLKITTLQLSVAVDQIGKLSLTLDGKDMVTTDTFKAVSYLAGTSAPNVLAFDEGSLLLNGTVSTTTGITSIVTGEPAVGVVSSVTIKIENKVETARYTLGSQTKKEQLRNAFAVITGTAEIEFASLADWYTAFETDTPLALHFALTGPKVGTGTNHSKIDVILPEIYWEGETPNAPGPGVIKVKVPFTALTDGKGDPICQVQYVTTTAAA